MWISPLVLRASKVRAFNNLWMDVHENHELYTGRKAGLYL